jgi:hypothetical protein
VGGKAPDARWALGIGHPPSQVASGQMVASRTKSLLLTYAGRHTQPRPDNTTVASTGTVSICSPFQDSHRRRLLGLSPGHVQISLLLSPLSLSRYSFGEIRLMPLTYGTRTKYHTRTSNVKVPDLIQCSHHDLNGNMRFVCWLRPMCFSSTLLPRFFFHPIFCEIIGLTTVICTAGEHSILYQGSITTYRGRH